MFHFWIHRNFDSESILMNLSALVILYNNQNLNQATFKGLEQPKFNWTQHPKIMKINLLNFIFSLDSGWKFRSILRLMHQRTYRWFFSWDVNDLWGQSSGTFLLLKVPGSKTRKTSFCVDIYVRKWLWTKWVIETLK